MYILQLVETNLSNYYKLSTLFVIRIFAHEAEYKAPEASGECRFESYRGHHFKNLMLTV